MRQQPSDRAWKRLENRLDGSAGVQRTLTGRWWLMAASVAIMVAATAGLILFTETSSQQTAQANGETFFVSEDLVQTDTDVQQYAAVQLQKRMESADWQPINEGKAGQKLVAVRVNQSPSRASKPQPQIARAKAETTEEVARVAPVQQSARTGGRPKPNAYADYQRLPGTWITTTADGEEITEIWQQHSGMELTNAGSPAVTARMPLIIGLQCYSTMCDLKMVLNQTGATQLYALTEKTENKFEFWSEGKGFPETVTLQFFGEKTARFIIEGGKPGSTQRKYLEDSGFVFQKNGSAVRTMKKQ